MRWRSHGVAPPCICRFPSTLRHPFPDRIRLPSCYSDAMRDGNVTVRILRLEDHDPDADLLRLTPEERIEMMWELTVDAWTFKGEPLDESRLQRHVVRVVRGEG